MACVCASVQLYEQILAENEKLKAQLRDTDLELADLKLQLEKATQVQAAHRTPAAAVGTPFLTFSLLSFQRQERYADRSQLEMEKRVKRVCYLGFGCSGTCVRCVCQTNGQSQHVGNVTPGFMSEGNKQAPVSSG